ncbi:hypothetical protein DYBT9275_00472 [Dyadobacter sp. CECT 9275]|uniref:Anti-sigma K factor RskA C-terminal domain-containing protein n=1 Tax=Dyadobacter helix TaxID=2822344 RepID=A0A916NAF7_9BACT|nr:anti-sigma factor [Dyadobacter sp. CECT 9275]CAG4990185.1 hypothetical protein DYBT9275_00472 [Dyadobacter sp. CECT 9275]
MNIQAYIESGILEEYVLGTVSPQEKQEVECMSHIYPEIKQELLRTENALEEYALKHQTAPPASLKESLFSKMNFEEIPVADEPDNAEVNGNPLVVPEGDSKVIDNVFIRQESKEVVPFWAKLSAAASVLLILFAGWAVMQMSDLKKQREALLSEANGLKVEMDQVKQEMHYSVELAKLYRDPSYKVIHMAGLEKSPQSTVAAFWNTQTNEVMLDVEKLPAAPEGKQYQLWSIVDGVPVDIGMLDHQFIGKVLRMKSTKAGPVAFAITLEKQGGSPVPTMTEMYVMGKV